ncbi:MAG TPA: sulfite exporter TauE/SafE family protein [Coriobacteriia bacterium]
MNLFLSLFAVGLVTSIHCVFMCGGLVLTYAVKGTEDGPWYRRLLPHLAYQGSKILSYAIVALALGGLVALLGRAVDITPFRNWLMVVAGFYMVLLGIGMTGKVKALRYLTPRPPRFLVSALSRERKKANTDAAEGHASLATPISFGLLTGLMPCAPLIAAQASAMSSGSPLLGAWGMIGFGLGTMPLMLLFGFTSSLLSRRFQAKLQIIAAIAVVLFGVVILNRGAMLVGSPVTFDTIRVSIVGGPVVASQDASGFAKGADGVVEIPLTIENTQFVPQTVSIPADTPVRLVVDRKEANACSAQLSIPAAKVLANLKDNAVTVVDVPAIAAGTYTLTCGMGMMSGSLVVGAAGATGGGTSPLVVTLLLVALAGGGYGVARLFRKDRAPQALASANNAGAKSSGKGGNPSAKSKGHSKQQPKITPSQKAVATRNSSTVANQGFTLWGYQPVEILIAVVLTVMAIIIGLASGGFFR